MELKVPKLNALHMTVILMVGLITYVILTKFVLVKIKLECLISMPVKASPRGEQNSMRHPVGNNREIAVAPR